MGRAARPSPCSAASSRKDSASGSRPTASSWPLPAARPSVPHDKRWPCRIRLWDARLARRGPDHRGPHQQHPRPGVLARRQDAGLGQHGPDREALGHGHGQAPRDDRPGETGTSSGMGARLRGDGGYAGARDRRRGSRSGIRPNRPRTLAVGFPGRSQGTCRPPALVNAMCRRSHRHRPDLLRGPAVVDQDGVAGLEGRVAGEQLEDHDGDVLGGRRPCRWG